MNASIRRIVFTIMIMLYATSLIPSTGRVANSNHEGDLRLAIQALQNLLPAATSSTTEFEQIFRDSVRSIQAVAGLRSIIMKKTSADEDKQPILIAVSFRLPHLLNGEIDIPPPAVKSYTQNFLISSSYVSPELSPDTPPPLFS